MPAAIIDAARHFAYRVRQRLGVASADGRDLDSEQARIRVAIGVGLILYTAYVVATGDEFSRRLQLVAFTATLPLLAGIGLLLWFRRNTARPASVRYFAICADLVPLTLGLWGADEPGVPLVGIYLWVTVGNGFRFGPRYLLFSYWVSLGCFALLMIFVPFWETHRLLGVGFMMILASIPLYVLLLLSRLNAQKDAAVELSNAKSLFVANVSHELRTPLTGVYAVYDLLRAQTLPPSAQELLGTFGTAIRTLKESVDDVLQMSRLEAGAEHAERTLFNLRYFLRRFSSLVEPQAETKRLQWRLEIGNDVPPHFVGDPGHLEHVLGNLVNNALKFTSQGSVTLKASVVPRGIRFEVADTGIGIAAEHQQNLFERFERGDQSRTRRYSGTGLGTSIAHDLVKLMGGDIGIVSAPGRGSTFWFELPAVEPSPGPQEPAVAPPREVALVAAPGPARDTLVHALRAAGCTPTTFDSTAALAPGRYDALLLQMPVENALQTLCASPRERSRFAGPLLVLAPQLSTEHTARLHAAGADAILPATPPVATLRRHLAALPSAEAFSAQGSAGSASVGSAGRPLSILLADDNPSNCLLLGRILEDNGHKVLIAARGDDAFDRMAEDQPDVALLDLNMPEMSGIDVTKLFRAGEVGSGQALPIIILSADATGAAREQSLQAGANDYLTKPVTAQALLAAISRVTGQEARGEARPESPTTKAEKAGGETRALALVDAERVDALKRIARHDRAFLAQYFEASFLDLENALRDLHGAMERGSEADARDALHKMDGTGASVGAIALLAGTRDMRNYLGGAFFDNDARNALAGLTSTLALTKSTVAAMLMPATAADRH